MIYTLNISFLVRNSYYYLSVRRQIQDTEGVFSAADIFQIAFVIH